MPTAYRLEMLTEEQCEWLKRETFLAAVESFEEIDSTNNYAIARSRELDSLRPLLVIADRQTAGRGRGANTWWSDGGALTFSILFSGKQLAANAQPVAMTSLAVGAAVCDAVAAIDPSLDVGLKWPNDVFVDGRKLAGILIECPSSLSGDVVVGIGINVNNSVRGAPAEIAARATSLTDLLDRTCEPLDVLARILHCMEYQLSQLQADPGRIVQRCAEFCVLTGRSVTLTIGSRTVSGTCLGIAKSGALLIQTGRETVECLAGHVEAIDGR